MAERKGNRYLTFQVYLVVLLVSDTYIFFFGRKPGFLLIQHLVSRFVWLAFGQELNKSMDVDGCL